jgi:hypothetical protein
VIRRQLAGVTTSAVLALFASPLHAQKKVAAFYTAETPIAVTLTTNMKRIRDDRDANAPYRPATMSYTDSGKTITLPARIHTRGIWRLKTCQIPPLRVNFKNGDTKHTIFKGVDNPKLVSICHDDDTGEQYVLQEFQLYRIYHLLTPMSHAARLVKMTYVDSASGKPVATRYAFFTEDPNALAERIDGAISKTQGAGPDDLEPFQDALVGVFQYMIGNTDFALSALHNAELISRKNGEYVPVVYDFDFSGAVNAKYATPAPQLHLSSVRERQFRGFCLPVDVYPKVFAVFNEKKDAIYALYKDPIGKLIRDKTVSETLSYFDDFYRTINNPREAKTAIVDGCLGGRK